MGHILDGSGGRIRHGKTLTDPSFDSDGALYHELTRLTGQITLPRRVLGNSGTSTSETGNWNATYQLGTCDTLCTHVRGAFKVDTNNALFNGMPANTWFNGGGTFVRVFGGAQQFTQYNGIYNEWGHVAFNDAVTCCGAMASFTFKIAPAGTVVLVEQSSICPSAFATNLDVTAFSMTFDLSCGMFT